MSASGTTPATHPARKPTSPRFDIALVFALCGLLFSLLIFVVMLKQERQAVVQHLQMEMAQDAARFEQRLSQVFYSLDALEAMLHQQPDLDAGALRQLVTSVAAPVQPLLAVQWQSPELSQLIPLSGSATLLESASIESLLQADDQVSVATDTGQGAVAVVHRVASDTGRLTALISLDSLIQKSLFSSAGAETEQAVTLLAADGTSLFSVQPGTESLAPEALFSLPINLPDGTRWQLQLQATESQVSAASSWLPGLFLLTGLLLSFLLAAYLKRMTRHLSALALEQEMMSEQMIDTSWTDPLTGLVNRIHFDEAVEVECRRAIREFSPLTLMLLRVDDFKAYVDHYGVDAAEILLHRLSDTLKHSVGRPGDMIARLDDHMFGFLLPSTNEMVVQLAQKCCDTVRELQVPHEKEGRDALVTLSVGVVTLQPSRSLTPEKLFDAAAALLDQASQAGGDRYQAHAETALEPSLTYST